MEFFKSTLYTCDCGYKTTSPNQACKHSKTIKCKERTMGKRDVEFVLKEDHDNKDHDNKETVFTISNDKELLEAKDNDIKKLEDIIKRQRKSIMMLTETEVECDDEDDEDIGSGLIYYVVDEDVPTRGKIGRTKNTDVKKLNSRYSTFSKPLLFCFFSRNIKKDENDLKAHMKEHGCMDASIGKETVHNCPDTLRIFHEFTLNVKTM
jgi:hypothetical protein